MGPVRGRDLVSNKIKLGQIESGIAGGVDTSSDAPIAVSEKLRKKLLKVNRAKGAKNQLLALTDLRPTDFGIASPGNTEPRTGLSMGEHMAQTAKTWGITREAQDELAVASHRNLAASYERGFQDDLVTSFKGWPGRQPPPRLLDGEAGDPQAGLRQG